MAIDFPASPTNGQTFTANNIVWVYDGTKWTAAVATGGAYVAKTGDTMSGPLLLSGDPSQALGAATKQYVDANYSGFVNKFRNGTFDVWQRGVPISVTSGTLVYIADGWMVNPGGATMSVAQATNNAITGGANPPKQWWGLWLQGATGMTSVAVQQRIESWIAATLGGVNITFQAKIYNQTGAAFTPTLAVGHATAQDNFGTVATDLAATNLQSCLNAQWTTVAYTFIVPSASALLGLYVQLQFGAATNAAGKNIAVAEADIRVTPGWPVGLCANPPPPELRHIQAERAFCQRYYQAFSQPLIGGYGSAAGTLFGQSMLLPVQMRAVPTVGLGTPAYSNASALVVGANLADSVRLNATVTATGAAWAVANPLTLSAEL